MLSESQIGAIVRNELDASIAYQGDMSKKRAKLMDYYNAQPYGDEVEGQSSVVTTEVANVVEWMLPNLLRIFTQGKIIGKFTANSADNEDEADEKTHLSNHYFMNKHNGVLILHDMFKDALLQYTGVVKVFWDMQDEVSVDKYAGMSEMEYQKLLASGLEFEEVEKVEDEYGQITYNVETKEIKTARGVTYVNIPPEEFLVSRNARNFDDPVFIGHRSPKTRSDLIQMGFSRDVVNDLPADEDYEQSEEKNARYDAYGNMPNSNPSNHSPNDVIYLGEYYMRIDVDEDGITEHWQVFYAGDKVLGKERVDDHPFAVCVPIPIPHRAIGSCPAEQAADLQFRSSTLTRQLLNNIYQSNYPRVLHSNKVELDDLLTPRPGGLVGIDTDIADVGGHAQMLQVIPMIEPLLRAIEQTATEGEVRTGMTRYSQGLDAESLNKTATGFLGIKDSSQQRMDLIARIFADGGVRAIFEKTVKLLAKYQDTTEHLEIMGEPLEIDPQSWGDNAHCRIDVGIGAGDRQEKIMNLNAMLQMQLQFKDRQMVIVDQEKIYNTMNKLVTEVGLKDVDTYFNNPEVEEETLFAQNEQLVQMVQQLQQQVQTNPLAEAEMIKTQGDIAQKSAQLEMDKREFAMEHARKMTELELKYKVDLTPDVDTSVADQIAQQKEIAEINNKNADTAAKMAKAKKDEAEAAAQMVEIQAVSQGLINAQAE